MLRGKMPIPLRVLLIEGSEDAALNIVRELQRGGYEPTWQRVDTPEALTTALAQDWQLITCDCGMLALTATAALPLIQQYAAGVPIIVIAEDLSTERAMAAMQAGAHDCISRRELARLVPAVFRELREAEGRQARRQAEEALHASQRWLELALSASNIGLWGWKVRTDEVPFSPRWKAQLGYADDEIPNQFEEWVKHLHPEDRDRILASVQQHLQNPSPEFELELRLRHKDGAYRWILARAALYCDATGQPDQLMGCFIDITDRKQTEAQLQQSLSLLRATLESTTDGILVVDRAGRMVTFNRKFVELWRIPDAVLASGEDRQALAFVLDQLKDPPSFAAKVDELYSQPDSSSFDILEFKDGRVFERHSQPQYIAGRSVGRVWSFRDITNRRRAEQKTAALLQIAHDISGTLELRALLKRVQQRTAEVLACDAVLTIHRDPEHDAFRILSHEGLPAENVAEIEALEFPTGDAIRERLAAGESVTVNDLNTAPPVVAQLCARFGITAFVAAPLLLGERQLGALVGLRTAPRGPFDADEVDLCAGIAGQLAVAIEAAELYRMQEDETQIAGALARVGRELIASLDSPRMLERLCQLTVEVLNCDFSHTWLWDTGEEVFTPAAAYGDPPEHWESLRILKLPRNIIAPLLERLSQDDIINAQLHDFPNWGSVAGTPVYAVTAALVVPLRHGGDILGFLSAGYRGRTEPFNPQGQRIARGIAQLASLGLENARLLQELERANRLKSDFVATMSHELRTPLNVIIGYNDLVLDRALGELTPDQDDSLRRVQKNARELLELITATLDVSRLETGRQPLDLREIGIAELLAEVDAETQGARMQKPRLRVEWNLNSGLPRLRTDPVKLKVVVKNLISNALKFTDEGGVTVAVKSRDGGVEFCVRDTGIGIPPDAQARIFEAFGQADSGIGRRYGGVGLGLYIVRRFLDLLGGSITLESEVGRGSLFRVWVPSRSEPGSRRP